MTLPIPSPIAILAADCARTAREVAGADPTDVDGRSLLPTEPQEGDIEALGDLLGRPATAEELREFSRAYAREMGA